MDLSFTFTEKNLHTSRSNITLVIQKVTRLIGGEKNPTKPDIGEAFLYQNQRRRIRRDFLIYQFQPFVISRITP